jgi:hypothetical protein
MNTDLKEYDRMIVKKDGYFLVGMGLDGHLRWSTSPWDAWHHSKRQYVIRVAKRVGGKMKIFNPIRGSVI